MDKPVLAILIILSIMNIVVVMLLVDKNMSEQNDEQSIVELKQKIYKIMEGNIWSGYHDGITHCNITKDIFELQSENIKSQVIIDGFTSIQEWHSECVRLVTSIKDLSLIELKKELPS